MYSEKICREQSHRGAFIKQPVHFLHFIDKLRTEPEGSEQAHTARVGAGDGAPAGASGS